MLIIHELQSIGNSKRDRDLDIFINSIYNKLYKTFKSKYKQVKKRMSKLMDTYIKKSLKMK